MPARKIPSFYARGHQVVLAEPARGRVRVEFVAKVEKRLTILRIEKHHTEHFVRNAASKSTGSRQPNVVRPILGESLPELVGQEQVIMGKDGVAGGVRPVDLVGIAQDSREQRPPSGCKIRFEGANRGCLAKPLHLRRRTGGLDEVLLSLL